MELEDTTGLCARIFRGEPEPGLMLCVVVAKAAFAAAPDGSTELRPAEWVEILTEPEQTPLGAYPSDQVPYRPGVDLFVHALAHAPGGRPTAAMAVGLRLGALTRTLHIIGDRRWTRSLRPTSPAPFVTMPLTYARAFGGQAIGRGEPLVWPDNPEGRGFVEEEAHAEGALLPNIEDPRDRTASWRDRPRVAGWAPLSPQSAIHLRRSVELLDAEKGAYRLNPAVFSCAHPDLVLPDLAPGTRGVLTGVDPSGSFHFTSPRLELVAEVELGPKTHRIAARMDTLGVLVGERRLIATYRASFRYRLIPKQIRRVRLSFAGPTGPARSDSP